MASAEAVLGPEVAAVALQAIGAVDHAVIFVRDTEAAGRFCEGVMGFAFIRELSRTWIEFRVGPNILALAVPRMTAEDAPLPEGSAALQLAFRVLPAEVDRCADELAAKGVAIASPPTDRAFGHRTLFFRDPDGNLLEIFAEIPVREP